MQHLETGTDPTSPHWGEKEQTVSAPVPLMTRTEVSHIPGILASTGNLISHVRFYDSNNMSSATSRSHDSALALIAAALSLKSVRNRSLLLLPRARRRLIRKKPYLGCSVHPLSLSLSLYGHSRLDHRVHVL